MATWWEKYALFLRGNLDWNLNYLNKYYVLLLSDGSYWTTDNYYIIFEGFITIRKARMTDFISLTSECHLIQAAFFLHVLDRFDFVPPFLSDIYGDLLYQVSLTSGMHCTSVNVLYRYPSWYQHRHREFS